MNKLYHPECTLHAIIRRYCNTPCCSSFLLTQRKWWSDCHATQRYTLFFNKWSFFSIATSGE